MTFGLIGIIVVASSLCIACTRRSSASIVYAVAVVMTFYFDPFGVWFDRLFADTFLLGDTFIEQKPVGGDGMLYGYTKESSLDAIAISRLMRCAVNVGFSLTLAMVAIVFERLINPTNGLPERDSGETANDLNLVHCFSYVVALVLWYYFALQFAGPTTRTASRFITTAALALAASRSILTKSTPAIIFVCVASTLLWLQRWFWMEGEIVEYFSAQITVARVQVAHHAFAVLTGLVAAFLTQLRLPNDATS